MKFCWRCNSEVSETDEFGQCLECVAVFGSKHPLEGDMSPEEADRILRRFGDAWWFRSGRKVTT